nr:hypothetical protein [Desulfobacula sp.]
MRPLDPEGILNILDQSDVRLTAQEYIKEIKSRHSLSFSEAKKILQALIDAEELSYHYLYGSTYVEKSFLRPVRISPHFILKPPWSKERLPGKHIEIMIEPGISFGSGQHPTTRLCLDALDFCFFKNQGISLQPKGSGADIGPAPASWPWPCAWPGFPPAQPMKLILFPSGKQGKISN